MEQTLKSSEEMARRVLIVEDEILVAIEIESVLGDMGLEPVGIAADSKAARRFADKAEIALVDINLRDGATGPQIGRELAEDGITVIFMTANPEQLGDGIPGTLGVLPKPVADFELRQALGFALAHRAMQKVPAPRRLQLFENAA